MLEYPQRAAFGHTAVVERELVEFLLKKITTQVDTHYHHNHNHHHTHKQQQQQQKDADTQHHKTPFFFFLRTLFNFSGIVLPSQGLASEGATFEVVFLQQPALCSLPSADSLRLQQTRGLNAFTTVASFDLSSVITSSTELSSSSSPTKAIGKMIGIVRSGILVRSSTQQQTTS